jgi:hypothetical protein
VLCALLAGTGCTDRPSTDEVAFEESERPQTDLRTHAVYRTTAPIAVDGRLSESDWAAADFVDIEGEDMKN